MADTPEISTITGLLHQHIDPAARCTSISRAPSGNSQETWFLDLDGIEQPRSLVLRRSAAGGTLEWSDRGTEVAVLGAARTAGLPVPRVWWWEPDGGALGRAYAVLDRAPGSNPDLRDTAVRSVLALELGRLIATLHQRVSPPGGLHRPATTVDATRSQLDFWTARARSAQVTPTIVAALCGWLAANVPDDDTDSVLLWGDPGPHNVLTSESGSITALLDWELAHVGHPLSDLGAARWSCLGHLDRELLTSAYEEQAQHRVDRSTLSWFEVLACVSRTVMLFDGVQAVLDGRSNDLNLLGLGLALVSANVLLASELAWGISVDDIVEPDAGDQAAALRPSPVESDLAVARFLTEDALAAVSDVRIRRGLKVAAALLHARFDEIAELRPAADPWSAYDAEVSGTTTPAQRRRLVTEIAIERHGQRSLLDLYGDAVTIGNVGPASWRSTSS